MNTISLAIALSEKLYKSHIKVLKYFLENPIEKILPGRLEKTNSG